MEHSTKRAGIYVASDHGGVELKEYLKSCLTEDGYHFYDLGVNSKESVDYPDYAQKLAIEMRGSIIEEDLFSFGILICGSGLGISMVANRFPWIRCAVCHDVTTARLSREHNNANVIALGERLIGQQTALDTVMTFLNTSFAGGRHIKRVDKLSHIDY